MNRKKVLEILNVVKTGLASKEIVAQTTNFVFDNGVIASYNDEIAMSHGLEEIDFSCVVPSAELLALIAKSKDEEIEMILADRELKISGKKFSASLNVQSENSLTIFSAKNKKFKKLPEKFSEAMKIAILSASKDASRPELTCVHVFGTLAQSCDGYRLSSVNLTSKMEDVLIPARVLVELLKHTLTEYCLEDSWIHFKIENDCLFSCRIVNVEYPDLTKPLAIENTHSIKFSKDMIDILDRAETMITDKINSFVTVDVSDGKVKISSKGDNGKFEETARIKSDKDKFTFQINPTFLKEVLMKNNEAEISTENHKIKFSGDNYFHIIVLVD